MMKRSIAVFVLRIHICSGSSQQTYDFQMSTVCSPCNGCSFIRICSLS